MGDPKGRLKAARRAMLKEGQPPAEKVRRKPPAPKKPAVRAVVRLADTDLDANKQVPIALMRIRGVGYNFARAVCTAAGIDHRRKLVELSEDEIERLEKVIKEPAAAGIPGWMLNRQRDPSSGVDAHITGAELPIVWRADIELQKRLHTWRGWRHELGLPVRGQRTRTSGRKGMRVGVIRKKAMPAARAREEREKKK